jgi:hypothetical protein
MRVLAFLVSSSPIQLQGVAMPKDQEDQGFRITDKRAFRDDGEIREDIPVEDAAKGKEMESSEPAEKDDSAQQKQETGKTAKIDFPSYVLSYYTQGLVLLGEVPSPYTQKREEDLDGARHTVDILALLQEKTTGNLSPEEKQLLDSVLYELRMKFMAKTNKIKL